MRRHITGGFVVAALVVAALALRFVWPRPSVHIVNKELVTRLNGEQDWSIEITNPFPYAIEFRSLPVETKIGTETSTSDVHPLYIDFTSGRLKQSDRRLEARSSWQFLEGITADARVHRQVILWSQVPETSQPRPPWKQQVDRLAVRLIGRPVFLRCRVARSPWFTSPTDRTAEREQLEREVREKLARIVGGQSAQPDSRGNAAPP